MMFLCHLCEDDEVDEKCPGCQEPICPGCKVNRNIPAGMHEPEDHLDDNHD